MQKKIIFIKVERKPFTIETLFNGSSHMFNGDEFEKCKAHVPKFHTPKKSKS